MAVGISDFGIEEAEKIYSHLKTSAVLSSTIGITMAVGAFLIVSRCIRVYKAAYSTETGRPDMKALMDMLSTYAYYMVIILALPFVVSFVEKIMGSAESNLFEVFGKEPNGAFQTVYTDAVQMATDLPEGPSMVTDGFGMIAQYVLTMWMRPSAAMLIKYLYCTVMVGRYIYLLMLEIAAPIAIVCLLDEKTQTHFYAWLKHMFCCYMMLPAFMIANAFGDAMVLTFFDNPYSFVSMIFQFIAKLYLFKFIGGKITALI